MRRLPARSAKGKHQFGGLWVCSRAVGRTLEVAVGTGRNMGEHQTRRPLPMLAAAGFEITESQQLKLGTVERAAAVKSS